MADNIKITIDGKEYEVKAGENLLQVCLDRGMLIPHFCYHEALGAVGSCRLCAAMVAPGADKPGRLDMTCMIRASEGMVVNVNDEYAKRFRKTLIEELMLNHPHDCPVCDEGGECMLQDMTVLSEHQHRRTRFAKRTWTNQYLGPLVHHEMNRCITCYRCVRYYDDYALGTDLGVFGARDRIYFGRVEDGVLESEFSGNLVDVCPTGVFTNKRFREVYSRPWDLQTAKSVCVNCSVGCNVLPGVRHQLLRRIKPLENHEVNRFFMCDRGRYGGEFVNSVARLKSARVDGQELMLEEGIERVAAKLKDIAQRHGAGSVAGIGSPRASMEANAALMLLVRALGGTDVTFFKTAAERAAVRRAAEITVSGAINAPGLPEIEQADFILNIGGDITGEAPMIDLSVRQSIRAFKAFFNLAPRGGRLDEHARASHRVAPSGLVDAIKKIGEGAGSPAQTNGGSKDFFGEAAAVLATAKNPVVLCSALHEDVAVIDAAFELAKRLKARLAYYYPGANSVGTALATKDTDPETVWQNVRSGKVKALVVLESNPGFYAETSSEFVAASQNCELILAIDSLESATTQAANAVLPCVSHYQSFGTFVNYEGRAQRFDGIQIPGPVTLASSEVLLHLVQEAGAAEMIGGTDFHDVYDVPAEMSGKLDAVAVNTAGEKVRGTRKPGVGGAPPPAGTQWPRANALTPYKIFYTFGSEELSALSPPVAELAPQPMLELHPDDAQAQKFSDDQHIDLSKDYGLTGKLRVNPLLAKGTIGIPVVLSAGAIVQSEVNS